MPDSQKVKLISINGIIGLAALIIAFISLAGGDTPVALAGMIIFLLAVSVAVLFWNAQFAPSSPLQIISSTTTLTICDTAGRRADAVKRQVFKVTHDGVTMIIDKGLWAEGRIRITGASCRDTAGGDAESMRWDVDTIASPTRGEVSFRFPSPPKQGHKYERTVELSYSDSFTSREEYFAIQVARRLETMIVEIVGPVGALFTKAWLRYEDESTIVEDRDTQLVQLVQRQNPSNTDEQYSYVKYLARYPKVGSIHRVYWIWNPNTPDNL